MKDITKELARTKGVAQHFQPHFPGLPDKTYDTLQQTAQNNQDGIRYGRQ